MAATPYKTDRSDDFAHKAVHTSSSPLWGGARGGGQKQIGADSESSREISVNTKTSRRSPIFPAKRDDRGFTPVFFTSLAIYAAYGLWLASHPLAVSSDDALFFLHALTRFSVLDFSPQFPGYPGFVAMGRLALLLTPHPLDALAFTALTVALLLPPATALIVWKVTGEKWRTLLAFLLTLACPLLPDMALSLLSDGSGILFLLVFLALLPRADSGNTGFLQPFLAGGALAWAGACRPSDAVMLAAALAGALFPNPRMWKPLLLGACAVTVPVLAVMFALEGTLYVREGLRFFIGNATLWGNTPFAANADQHGSWFTTILALPGGPVMLALALFAASASIRQSMKSPAALAASLALLGHGIWILAFQNPDHLRHLAPILVLGGLLLPMIVRRQVPWASNIPIVLFALAELFCLVRTIDFHAEKRPPLEQAVAFLREEPKAVVATNNGVFTLRVLLPRHRIYDMHYPADARLGLATAHGPAYRLTTTQPADAKDGVTFPGRFAGEETMWLVPVSRSGG